MDLDDHEKMILMLEEYRKLCILENMAKESHSRGDFHNAVDARLAQQNAIMSFCRKNWSH